MPDAKGQGREMKLVVHTKADGVLCLMNKATGDWVENTTHIKAETDPGNPHLTNVVATLVYFHNDGPNA